MQFLHSSDKIAIIYKDEQINHNTLIQRIQFYSKLYQVSPGDRIAVCSENRPEWVYAFYSGWQNQAISVPIDVLSTAEEIAYIINNSRPKVLFTSRQQSSLVQKAIKLSSREIELIIFEDLPELPAISEESFDFMDNPKDDIATIVYTSGTTGDPKGVMLSFENLHANLYAVSTEVPIYRSDDRAMVLLPLHHVLPLQGTLIIPLFLGAASVFSPSLVAADILATLQNHHITLFVGVPRLYILLHKGILAKIKKSKIASALFFISDKCNSIKFSRLLFHSVQKKFGGKMRCMPCGGAPMDPQIVKDFKTLGFEILMGYGMTETAPMISFTHPGFPRHGSVGQIIPCNEVRSKDGEIIARGKNIMKGYFEQPEETAKALQDGWLHTGDLGYVDKDNYIYLTGRKKELIVLPNGKNISPDEIEQKFMSVANNLISEAAVLASNEALHVLILPNMKEIKDRKIVNIEDTIRQEVIRKYNQHSSSYKRILKCTLISEPLPRTRLGKIQRHKLANLISEQKRPLAQKIEEPKSEEYRILKTFLKDQTGLEVFPADNFELDLSLDSLNKISFMVFLSATFSLDINEEILTKYPTPLSLAAYLQTQETTVNISDRFNWGELFKQKTDIQLPQNGFTHQWLNRFSRIVLKFFFKLKSDGLENIPEGPCIFAPNHQSYLDGLFVSAFFHKATLKDTYFYAKSDHVKSWWKRSLAKHHNIIVMDLNKNLKLSLQKLAAALRNGKKIILFPEGTRSFDGSLGDFKKTFAILGQELRVPIVPIAIEGAFQVLPRGKKFPHLFRPVTVSFLPPVYPDSKSTYAGLTTKIENILYTKLEKKKS
ncbi:MAG: AMP-binding protein [Lentisphaeria bacterium]